MIEYLCTFKKNIYGFDGYEKLFDLFSRASEDDEETKVISILCKEIVSLKRRDTDNLFLQMANKVSISY